MRTKDQILLENAYIKIYESELNIPNNGEFGSSENLTNLLTPEDVVNELYGYFKKWVNCYNMLLSIKDLISNPDLYNKSAKLGGDSFLLFYIIKGNKITPLPFLLQKLGIVDDPHAKHQYEKSMGEGLGTSTQTRLGGTAKIPENKEQVEQIIDQAIEIVKEKGREQKKQRDEDEKIQNQKTFEYRAAKYGIDLNKIKQMSDEELMKNIKYHSNMGTYYDHAEGENYYKEADEREKNSLMTQALYKEKQSRSHLKN